MAGGICDLYPVVTLSAMEHGSMIARKFGKCAWWTTREVRVDAGNGFCFATGSLIHDGGVLRGVEFVVLAHVNSLLG